MIVDDEPGNIPVLERVLSTTDPTESVEKYEINRPYFLLLDGKIPKMNGFKVLARLCEIEHNYLPAVTLTAQQNRDILLKTIGPSYTVRLHLLAFEFFLRTSPDASVENL